MLLADGLRPKLGQLSLTLTLTLTLTLRPKLGQLSGAVLSIRSVKPERVSSSHVESFLELRSTLPKGTGTLAAYSINYDWNSMLAALKPPNPGDGICMDYLCANGIDFDVAAVPTWGTVMQPGGEAVTLLQQFNSLLQ